MFLKEFQERLFNELTLKGIHEISKVTFSKYDDKEYDDNGAEIKPPLDPNDPKKEKRLQNWMIETDGVALQKVLGFNKIDFRKTTSNDLIEILKVLGIEAVRMTLINELRFVLNAYGIYVNYRHLSTLCDIMTQRGKIKAIIILQVSLHPLLVMELTELILVHSENVLSKKQLRSYLKQQYSLRPISSRVSLRISLWVNLPHMVLVHSTWQSINNVSKKMHRPELKRRNWPIRRVSTPTSMSSRTSMELLSPLLEVTHQLISTVVPQFTLR